MCGWDAWSWRSRGADWTVPREVQAEQQDTPESERLPQYQLVPGAEELGQGRESECAHASVRACVCVLGPGPPPQCIQGV